MEEIFKRCEDVLVELESSKTDNAFLDDLSFAQTYKLNNKTAWNNRQLVNCGCEILKSRYV